VSESKHYQDRGYQVFRGALPLKLVDAVAELARKFIDYGGNAIRQNGSFASHDFFPGTKLIRNSPANMHLPLPDEQAMLSAALRELVSSQALAACLRKLDGAKHYNVHQSLLFYVGQTTEMHIDSWSVDTAPHGFSHTLWIPLQDIDPNSGSIAVVPWPQGKVITEKELGLPETGTHRERHDRYHSALKEKILSERPEVIATFLRRGDFVAWTSLTPHLSLISNPFPRERLSLQVLVVPAHHRRGTFVDQPAEWFADRTIRINDDFSFYVPENITETFGIRAD
jgi:ectoine hydroxylase-related dioxygenase (phytanoyl-CoA dioxygenase family)